MTAPEIQRSLFRSRPADYTPQAAYNALFDEAILAFRGDREAARRHLDAMTPDLNRVQEILRPFRRGDASAVNEVKDIFSKHGLPEHTMFEFFRSQNVPNAGLRAAGLRPVDVRPQSVIEDLIPSITGDDEAQAIEDLKRGLRILRDKAGLTGPESLYVWLSENVSDAVMAGAGIDYEAAHAANAPADLHPDLAALVEVGRAMLESMKGLRNLHVEGEELLEIGRTFEAFMDTTAPVAASAASGVPLSSLVTVPLRG